jgi:hypothetical protein
MSVQRIAALGVSVLVLTAGALAGGTAGAAGQAAARETAAGTVTVSITAAHNVTMPATIQPGVTTFRVTTEAKQSGFQLVQLAAGYTLDQAIADIDAGLENGKIKALKRFEAHATLLGGVSVPSGKIGKLTVNLPVGSYYAADIERNRPSAFTAFTVAGADTGATMPAGPTLTAVRSTSWAKSPRAISHKGMLTFTNHTDNNHFVGLVKLAKGKTAKDFGAWIDAAMQGEEGPPPVNFRVGFDGGVVSPGHTVAMNYRLPKGDYVLACFWPDASMGGMPHAFMGMYRGITLK